MGSRSRLCSVGYGMLVTNPRLRINLVALLCTFSIFSINCTDCGHHTWDGTQDCFELAARLDVSHLQGRPPS